METIKIQKIEELNDLAKNILEHSTSRIFFLTGNLGTGKTTLIKEFIKELGSSDEVSSPTYSIVNEYNTIEKNIYHFDLYRLKSLDELFDFGFEEYIYSGNYCFIEWSEIIESWFDEPKTKIHITNNQTERVFEIEY